MTRFLLPLLAVLTPGDSLPPPTGVGVTAEGAAVVVHRQPAVPLVALRMAVLADDPPGYAGAGHLLQHLVQRTLAEQAAVVGARVQLQRTSDAVAYTVTGPAAELDYLAEILRSVLRPPQASEAALLVASRELAEERLAEWETADRHVRSLLRSRLFPSDLSAAGTEASANRLMEGDAFRTAWSQLYRPDRVSVIAVGDVTLERVQAAFSELPAPAARRPAEAGADTVELSPLAPAEATQAWLGAAYLLPDAEPAALSVAARVIQGRLRAQLPAATVVAEHWWTHHGQALAVIVSVPGPGMSAAQRALGTAVSSAARDLTGAQAYDAARAIARDMLFYARTPERMAEVLGQFTDRAGEPDAAQRFYASLERVGADEVREVLEELLERTPERVEIPPQRLQRRR